MLQERPLVPPLRAPDELSPPGDDLSCHRLLEAGSDAGTWCRTGRARLPGFDAEAAQRVY